MRCFRMAVCFCFKTGSCYCCSGLILNTQPRLALTHDPPCASFLSGAGNRDVCNHVG